jgi:mRNA-degrading endonuclease RelE of RelBE toxin-antitoxin system
MVTTLARARSTQQRLDGRIGPPAALQGEPGLLRIRVGDFRIIYTVQHDVLTVLVVTVGQRRNVYQRR